MVTALRSYTTTVPGAMHSVLLPSFHCSLCDAIASLPPQRISVTLSRRISSARISSSLPLRAFTLIFPPAPGVTLNARTELRIAGWMVNASLSTCVNTVSKCM